MGLDKIQSQVIPEVLDVENEFSESVVRDPETGKLLVVNHYSDSPDIKRFALGRKSTFKGDKGFFGAGIYFTGIEGSADSYGEYRYDVNLNLKNPLMIKNATMDDVNKLHGERDKLIAQGYDGVMVWSDEVLKKEIVSGRMKIKQQYRQAGWSEISVFNPDSIHIIEVNKK